MKNIVVGVGGIAASKTPGEVIKTYALGSCVAMILSDLKTNSVGMVHIALPSSEVNPQKSNLSPGYFADTGIPALIQLMTNLGSSNNGRGMIVKLVGGANILDANNTFEIGKRNILTIKKILWSKGMGSLAEDVGGSHSRTVSLSVDTKEVRITSFGRKDVIL